MAENEPIEGTSEKIVDPEKKYTAPKTQWPKRLLQSDPLEGRDPKTDKRNNYFNEDEKIVKKIFEEVGHYDLPSLGIVNEVMHVGQEKAEKIIEEYGKNDESGAILLRRAVKERNQEVEKQKDTVKN